MRDNTIYYLRHDKGRHSTVFAGTFDHLKRCTFQGVLQDIKDRSKKPFFWPKDIQQLVRTLNYGTTILNEPSDFFTLTTKEMADKHHWPILDTQEQS